MDRRHSDMKEAIDFLLKQNTELQSKLDKAVETLNLVYVTIECCCDDCSTCDALEVINKTLKELGVNENEQRQG